MCYTLVHEFMQMWGLPCVEVAFYYSSLGDKIMAIVATLICQSTEHDTDTPGRGEACLTGTPSVSIPYIELKIDVSDSATFEQFNPGKTYKMTLEQVD